MPGGAPSSASRRSSSGGVLQALLILLARGAALALLLTLAYQLYAVFGGGLRSFPAGYSAGLARQLSHNLDVAGNVLGIAAVALAIAAVLFWWGWEWAAPILLAAAAVFYLGLPFLAIPKFSAAALDARRALHPGLSILMAWRVAGGAFGLAGALFLAGWAWDHLRMSLSAPRRAGGLKVPFYSACWQTHYCKDEINKLCEPGRRGYRKSCWRYKSGCFCDESIADKMLAKARKGAGDAADAFFGPRGKAPAPTLSDRLRSTRHRAPNQKIACASCPIYNYHEIQKHRIMAPIVIVAIPALMFYFGEAIHRGYAGILAGLETLATRLAFNPATTAALQRQIHGALGVPAMEWLVLAVVCLLLITTGARVLEWWCFTAKL